MQRSRYWCNETNNTGNRPILIRETWLSEKMIIGLKSRRRVEDDLVKGGQGKGWVAGGFGGKCILGTGKGWHKGSGAGWKWKIVSMVGERWGLYVRCLYIKRKLMIITKCAMQPDE